MTFKKVFVLFLVWSMIIFKMVIFGHMSLALSLSSCRKTLPPTSKLNSRWCALETLVDHHYTVGQTSWGRVRVKRGWDKGCWVSLFQSSAAVHAHSLTWLWHLMEQSHRWSHLWWSAVKPIYRMLLSLNIQRHDAVRYVAGHLLACMSFSHAHLTSLFLLRLCVFGVIPPQPAGNLAAEFCHPGASVGSPTGAGDPGSPSL